MLREHSRRRLWQMQSGRLIRVADGVVVDDAGGRRMEAGEQGKTMRTTTETRTSWRWEARRPHCGSETNGLICAVVGVDGASDCHRGDAGCASLPLSHTANRRRDAVTVR